MAKNKYLFIILLIVGCATRSYSQNVPVRERVKSVYVSQIGVREKTGHNDGVMVETYLRYCGLPKGQPWCASFVCWCYNKAGVKNPRSGFCPDLFLPKHIVYKRTMRAPQNIPQTGDIGGLYFPEKGRIAHTFFIDTWGEKYVLTVEGNTNEAGSREGDGVYRKRRPKSSIYAVASYIN